MSVHQVPSAFRAVLAIAEVTLRRLLRGRAIWVSCVIAGLPFLYASVMHGKGERHVDDELFVFSTLVLAVVAPMFIASSIGEEIETRTLTYLWSRPVPRWSVPAGKLAALAPLALAIVLASWIGSVFLATGHVPTLRSCFALALGALALSTVATGLASLSPRHGLPFSIVFSLFFDLPVGVLPASISKVSISNQMRILSGLSPKEAAIGSAVLALVVISIVWSALATWRIRRLET
ncbi:MAG: ABC transporter permease [Kofleriaceae bacterium]|nr:ABC transporter permease [Kofleriaceae bacterium]